MRRRFIISTAVADLFSFILAVLTASCVVFRTPPWDAPLAAGQSLWPLIGFFAAGGVLGSVISVQSWKGVAPRPSYGRALTIISIATITAAVLLVGTGAYRSRVFFTLVPVVWFLAASAYRALQRARPWSEPMILITPEKDLAADLINAPHADVLEILDPGESRPPSPPDIDVSLVVDLRAVLSQSMAQYVSSCVMGGTKVRALTTVYEEHTGRFPLVHLAEGWELRIPVSRSATYQFLKTWIDRALVIITSVLWLPLSTALWVLIRVDSPGPAIFKQERVGLHGKPFTLYKFRTMAVESDNNSARMTVIGDERITRAGRYLRRFRVDELPQLFNVLTGTLNLVGPRPEQVPIVESYRNEIPFYDQRHLIRPGVTGWAQVHYGYADDKADSVEKLAFDLFYVKNLSPWIDIHILLKSVWTVLSGFGHQ